VGIKAAFEKALEKETIVPGHCHFMGALGVAMLAGFSVNGETKSFFEDLPSVSSILNQAHLPAVGGPIFARSSTCF
jgi:hypothetical protein